MSADFSEDLASRIERAIIKGDEKATIELAREALDGGFDPAMVIEEGFVPALKKVGALFNEGELFLPELMISGEAMKAAMTILSGAIKETGGNHGSRPIIVLGTVEGDVHEIGKNIVGIMLEAAGFEVLDLGMDVGTQAFIDKIKERRARVVGASALLTTTMERQRELVKAAKDEGLDVKIIVGGAPTSLQWADEIGAHGFAENASDAVDLVKRLLEMDGDG